MHMQTGQFQVLMGSLRWVVHVASVPVQHMSLCVDHPGLKVVREPLPLCVRVC